MKLEILSVHDSKAEAFITPFFSPNIPMAKRSFAMAVNDPETNFHKWAEDYTLFHVGSYDQDTGTLTPLDPIVTLGNALTYISNDSNQPQPASTTAGSSAAEPARTAMPAKGKTS